MMIIYECPCDWFLSRMFPFESPQVYSQATVDRVAPMTAGFPGPLSLPPFHLMPEESVSFTQIIQSNLERRSSGGHC